MLSRLGSVILDGEMLVWEPRLRKYMPFGNLKSFSSSELCCLPEHLLRS